MLSKLYWWRGQTKLSHAIQEIVYDLFLEEWDFCFSKGMKKITVRSKNKEERIKTKSNYQNLTSFKNSALVYCYCQSKWGGPTRGWICIKPNISEIDTAYNICIFPNLQLVPHKEKKSPKITSAQHKQNFFFVLFMFIMILFHLKQHFLLFSPYRIRYVSYVPSFSIQIPSFGVRDERYKVNLP